MATHHPLAPAPRRSDSANGRFGLDPIVEVVSIVPAPCLVLHLYLSHIARVIRHHLLQSICTHIRHNRAPTQPSLAQVGGKKVLMVFGAMRCELRIGDLILLPKSSRSFCAVMDEWREHIKLPSTALLPWFVAVANGFETIVKADQKGKKVRNSRVKSAVKGATGRRYRRSESWMVYGVRCGKVYLWWSQIVTNTFFLLPWCA